MISLTYITVEILKALIHLGMLTVETGFALPLIPNVFTKYN